MADVEKEDILKMKIGFIGGGNMCKAIVPGLMTNFNPNQILIYGPHPEKLQCFTNQGNILASSMLELINSCDVIVLSIKPIMLETIAKQFHENLRLILPVKKYIISILAGTPISKIRSLMPQVDSWSYIRVMPNTPMMVGYGSIVYSLEKRSEFQVKLVQILLGSCSKICEEIPERLINSAAAVSGSGPAYCYLIIEALADGGVKMGLPRDLAMKLAAHTLIGASKMVVETGKHPGLLKDEVCSPGGTTIEGMHALEQGGVRNSLINAVEAATNKAIQMERQ